MSTSGVITSIDQDWRGDTLTVAAASGDTVLQVNDAGDFSEDAATVTRYLIVGTEATPRQYVDVDMDADTVTLAATVGGSGLEVDLPVVLWDPTVGDSGSRVVEYVAAVALHDDSGTAPAVIPHELIPASGVYGLVGASVSITDDDEGEWWIERVLGREAVVDFNYLDPTTLPPAIPGQTFSTSPPSVTTGFVEGHVWWQWQAGTPPEVIGFWRLESGAWVETAIISYEVLAATNAFITYLNATDLSAASITGALFRTNASGQRTEISDNLSGGAAFDVRFYTDNANETLPGYVGGQDTSGNLITYLVSPTRNGRQAGVRLNATASDTGASITADAITLNGDVNTNAHAINVGGSTVNLSGGNLNMGTGGTITGTITATGLTGTGTQAIQASSTGVLSRVTSSRRYKRAIEDLDVDLDALRTLRPVQYRRIEEGDDGPVYAGFIAEEVAATGHEHLVARDADGEVDGIHEPGMVAALWALVADQQRQIDELRARLD